MNESAYEMVIGLETHIELKTASKIFCSCPTTFGAEPNTQCCPVCTGMPGALPVLNRRVVELAIKAGLATNCSIAMVSKQDRKNYFYPDLPKAYQISQYDLPLCSGGWLDVEPDDKTSRRVRITRIHIEEDAGKLIHLAGKGTLVDCNRCGVPLIEVVTEPDLRSAAEARAYLLKLRAIMLYTGVSDCRMNEGSLRCDVNLSVRKKGGDALGTRTEMKNLNSFSAVVRAIESEFVRQVGVLEQGGEVVQETRRFDAQTGKTSTMRRKEEADDYRYFPDPDLAPIVTSDQTLQRLRAQIPQLPDQRKAMYQQRWGLSSYVAEQITCSRTMADFFEQAAARTRYPALAAKLTVSEIFRLAQNQEDEAPVPLAPGRLAAAADLLGDGRLNPAGCRRLLESLWQRDGDPAARVEELDLGQISDPAVLEGYARQVLDSAPAALADYRRGKMAAFQALMGQVMGRTGGRGDPAAVKAVLERLLEC